MDKLLEKHVVARVVSIVLALMLWLFVVSEQNPEIDRNLVIEPEIRGLPADLVLMEEVSPVSLRMRGRRSEVLNITEKDVSAYINLAGAQEGENEVRVRLADAPVGIHIESITPSELLIHLEKVIQEQVPIRLVLEGEPGQGYAFGEEILSPTQVMVEGPRSRVERVARVIARVTVEDATDDVRAVVPVQVLDRQGNPLNQELRVRPEVVDVQVPVEALPSKDVEVVPRIVGSPAQGYQVEEVLAEPTFLTIYAPQGVLNSLHRLDTAPFDIGGASGDVSGEVRLLVPDDVSASLERVQVTVKIGQRTQEKTLTDIPLQVRNLEEGKEAQLEPGVVAVTLAGPFTVVNPLQPGDIQAFVEAAGLGEGRHRLAVQVEVPGGVEKLSQEPEEVTLTISPQENDS